MAFRRASSENEDQLELFAPTGRTHEHTHPIRPDGPETLAGVPPEDGAAARSAGEIAGDALRGPGKDQRRDDGTADAIDKAGPDAATGPRPGLGDGEGTLHPAATRRQRSARVEPLRNQANYRITDADRLGEGSLKQKYRRNVEVIRLLRQLERQNQPAYDEQKAIFVRYVGWGGLPQVFDAGNREWRKEHGELAELLTEEEYRSARASTLNAHYTAPNVIRAMYAALERFGFRQGRILEPACGIGHFIGLMPEEMHHHS